MVSAVPIAQSRFAFADQLASSATNFLVSVVAARQLSQPDFGRFAIGLTVAALIVGASRALLAEPILVGLTQASGSHRAAVSAALTGSVIVGLPASVVTGMAVDSISFSVALFSFIACVMAQDILRFVAIGSGRAMAAVASDVAWPLALFVGILVGVSLSSPTQVFILNAAAAFIGACTSLMFGVRQEPRGAKRLVLECIPLGTRLLASQGLAFLSSSVAMLATASVAGPSVVAAVRGSYLLAGPFNTASQGLFLGAAARRESGPSYPSMWRRSIGLTAKMASLALVFGALLSLMPAGVGEALLGATWASVEGVIPLIALTTLLGSLAVGPQISLRIGQQGSVLVRVSLITTPLSAFLPPAGALIYGVTGFFIGVAVAAIALNVASWWAVWRISGAGDRADHVREESPS